MWESLPPVVSVATGADDLVGVSMAVQAEGMMSASRSGSTPPTLASTRRSCSATTGPHTATQHAVERVDARVEPAPRSASSTSSAACQAGLAHNAAATGTGAAPASAPRPSGPLSPSWASSSTPATAGTASPLPGHAPTAAPPAPSAVPLWREMSGSPPPPPPRPPPRGGPSSTSLPDTATSDSQRQCPSPPSASAANLLPVRPPFSQLENPTGTAAATAAPNKPTSVPTANASHDAAPPHASAPSTSDSVTCGSPASPPSSSSVMGAAAASIVWSAPAAARRQSGASALQAASPVAAVTRATANASDTPAPADGQAVLYAAVNPFKDLHRHGDVRGGGAARAPGTAASTPSLVPPTSRSPQPVSHTSPCPPNALPHVSPVRQRVPSPAPTPARQTAASTQLASAAPASSAAAVLPSPPSLMASTGSGIYRSTSLGTVPAAAAAAAAAASTTASSSPARITRVPSGQFREGSGAAYARYNASAPAPVPPPPPPPRPASLWESEQPASYAGAPPNVFTTASAMSGSGFAAPAIAPVAAHTAGSPYGALPLSYRTASPLTPPQRQQRQPSQRSMYGSVTGNSGRRSDSLQASGHGASHVRFQGIGGGGGGGPAAPGAANVGSGGLAGLSPPLPHLRPSTPGRYAGMDGSGTASVPHDGSISFAATVDHNQSFYMGTMGNDNLRRSFFFPLGPMAGMAGGAGAGGLPEDAWGRSGDVNGPASEVPPHPHAASVCSARTPGRATPSTAHVGGNPNTGATPGAAAPSPHASAVEGKPSPSTSSLAADPYCSPTLLRSPSFHGLPLQHPVPSQPPPPPPPTASPYPPYPHPQPQPPPGPSASTSLTSPPTTGAVSRLTAASLLANSAQAAGAAPHTYVPASAHAPSSLYDSPGALAQPLTLSMPATYGRRGGSGHVPWQAVKSTPSPQPPALAGAVPQQQQPQQPQQPGMATSSRSSSLAAMADASRNTGFTDASFISPTLANTTWQVRFDGVVGGGQSQAPHCPVAPPDISAQMHGGLAAPPPLAQPLMWSASDPSTSGRRWSSSTSSSQAKPAAPPPPALPPPPPAYIVDWEQSLVAFQSRAESYYTFKNVCTETYLTLIEHDVDRFLVCYYSGGVIPPEEAVQEALARRGNFNPGAGGVANTGSADGKRSSGGSGGGLQKMLQGSKTLLKLSETGTKWLSKVGTNLRRNGGATVAPPGPLLAAAPPPQTPRAGATAPDASADAGLLDHWATPTTMAAPVQSYASPDEAAAAAAGTASCSDAPASAAQAGPSRLTNPFAGNPLEVRRASGDGLLRAAPSRDSVASLGALSSISSSARPPSSSAATSEWPAGDAASSTASHVTAAEAEVTCLRQLGPYVANVVPETYMDARPSEGVLAQVRRNHAILLHALQHVLTDTRGGAAGEASAGGGNDVDDGRTPSPPAALTQLPSPATSSSLGFAPAAASVTADTLVTRRLRSGLMQPTIQSTWRDYLTPLESKVRELAQIAAENIEPILVELRAPRCTAAAGEGAWASAPSSLSLATPSAPAPGLWREGPLHRLDTSLPMDDGERAAREALRAARETPVSRLVRLLRGDEEYLAMIHTMDDEFLDDGVAWQQRSAQMRLRGAALCDYVPVYGLVLSRLHRLEMEYRTVLELWGGGVA